GPAAGPCVWVHCARAGTASEHETARASSVAALFIGVFPGARDRVAAGAPGDAATKLRGIRWAPVAMHAWTAVSAAQTSRPRPPASTANLPEPAWPDPRRL